MNCETALVIIIIMIPNPFHVFLPLTVISLLKFLSWITFICSVFYAPQSPSVSRHAWTPQFLLIISKLP